MRRHGRWLRPTIGLGLVVVLIGYAGPEALLSGVRGVDPALALIALAVTAGCTGLAGWRWVTIVRATGLTLSFSAAVTAYYRSQLINLTVPGGIVGDIDRAIWHGREQRAVARAGGAVAVERVAGQTVQLLLAAIVVIWLGPGAGVPDGLGLLLAAACVVCAVAVSVFGATAGLTRDPNAVRVLLPVLVTSVLIMVGYGWLFVLAARAVGVDAPVGQLLPVALIVVVASAIPLHVAGWGPREGAAAWLFAGVGLGGDVGVSAAVTYGLISLIGVLPGLVPLILGGRPRLRNAAVTRFGAH